MKNSIPNRQLLSLLRPVKTVIPVLLFSSILVACSDENTASLPSSITQDIQGVWDQSGYGLLLNVDGETLTVYEATRATCYRRDTGSVADFIQDFPNVQIDGDQLLLSQSELGLPAVFNRIDTLPFVCDDPIGESITEQFDHVWHTFNDYYAFFNERGVDWMAQYDAWRPALNDQSSEQELADALIGLITPLDDSHVSLTFKAGDDFNPAKTKGFIADLVSEFEAQSDVTDEASYVVGVLNQWRTDIQAHYIGAPFKTLSGPNADLVQWGIMGDAVGYLSINQLFTTLEASEAADVAAFDDALDLVLTDLANTSALIIDVRLSPGGRDAVSIAIANRFADTERLAVTKAARDYQGLQNSQYLTIRPSDRQNYANPIILITSGFSVSATETFTLLMRALPQVTHMGEPTNGALSDLLEKGLPSGWNFTLSNEVYQDFNGNAFEGVGIPPMIPVSVLSKSARDRGEDSALNAAFETLALPNPVLQ